MRIGGSNLGQGPVVDGCSGAPETGGASLGGNDMNKFMQGSNKSCVQNPGDNSYGAGPADTGFYGQNGVNGSSSEQENKIRQNPELLTEKGQQGMDIEGMDLQTGQDGKLTEDSKKKVNELIGNLSDKLGVEVSGDVYKAQDGSMKVHLTSGTSNSVTHNPPSGTVYSAHTHPGGSSTPSSTDLANEIKGAEDAVVPCDGVAGNEDGSNYTLFG